jgi:hypothetical protein
MHMITLQCGLAYVRKLSLSVKHSLHFGHSAMWFSSSAFTSPGLMKHLIHIGQVIMCFRNISAREKRPWQVEHS